MLTTNVDAMDIAELEEFRDALHLLSAYVLTKSKAMAHRLDGKTALARMYEEVCERLFKQLPDDMKW